MRVNDRNLTSASAAESGRSQETQKLNRTQGVKDGIATTDRSGDRVELSSTLEQLSRAMSAFGSERASRVQALAAQYRSGNYHVDSLAVARGMVSEALLPESA
ncbi:MAG: flagellar biosynthesis anti-sigma factor FlgM [Bryobacteraceae bacterium]|jgi:flagellar biosynthesis anti-sigma factor FlgM